MYRVFSVQACHNVLYKLFFQAYVKDGAVSDRTEMYQSFKDEKIIYTGKLTPRYVYQLYFKHGKKTGEEKEVSRSKSLGQKER